MSSEAQGEQKAYSLANKWSQPNTTMRDLDSTNDVIAVIPQDEVLDLDIKFYFSKVPSIREDARQDSRNPRNKFNPLVVIPSFLRRVYPVTIPWTDFLNYTTFIVSGLLAPVEEASKSIYFRQ